MSTSPQPYPPSAVSDQAYFHSNTPPGQVSDQAFSDSGTQPPRGSVPDAQQADASQSAVQQRSVDDPQLVQSQITNILNGENPYIRRARERAMETANSRGVLNSSIAANAGEAAAIDAAMPIAQQDAKSYFDTAQDNMSATNAANLQDAQGRTEVSISNADSQNKLIGADQDFRNDTRVNTQKAQIAEDKAHLDANLDTEAREHKLQLEKNFTRFDAKVSADLAKVNQAYKVELESLKSEYAIEQQMATNVGHLYAEAMKSIASLMQNSELSGSAVQSRTNTILRTLRSSLEFDKAMSGDAVVPTAGGKSNTKDTDAEEDEGETDPLAQFRDSQNSGLVSGG